MAKPKILVCDPLAEEGLAILRAAGEVEVVPGLSEAELIARVPGYAALVVRSGVKITAPVIEAASDARVIARAGVGVDNIDVDAATRQGILVVNSPGGNTLSTAEHALALLLALARRIPQAQASLAAGKWDRKSFMGHQVTGKTLGIIGLGRIGGEVARRARGLEMTVLACDPFVAEEQATSLGVRLVGLETLLRESDYVTLHASLTDGTRGMIGAEELALMKPTGCLINCARGGLVDEAALLAALTDGRIGGAAVDVYTKEPPDDFTLAQLPNVVATPHLAASTAEAQEIVALDAAEQVAAVLRGELPRWPVNAPSLPQEMAAEVGRYMPICTALGRLQRVLVGGGLKRVELRGDNLSPEQLHLLLHHLLAALFEGQTDAPVNYINAVALVRERGIEVSESAKGAACAYGQRLEAVTTDSTGTHLCAAVVLEDNYVRLVEVEGFRSDVELSGKLMLLWNNQPGVPGFIGRLGCMLGDAGVSIQGIQVASGLVHGHGLLLAQLEQGLDEDLRAAVRKLPGVARLEWVDFS
jgi:D-3-phosphoglycerate dehydrogenase